MLVSGALAAAGATALAARPAVAAAPRATAGARRKRGLALDISASLLCVWGRTVVRPQQAYCKGGRSSPPFERLERKRPIPRMSAAPARAGRRGAPLRYAAPARWRRRSRPRPRTGSPRPVAGSKRAPEILRRNRVHRLVLGHADHRIVVAGHADVGDEGGAAGEDLVVGGRHVGMGADHQAGAAVAVECPSPASRWSPRSGCRR